MSCREREGVSYLDGAFSLFPYEGDFRRLLHAYKFDGARPLVHFLLGRLLENLVPVLPDDFKDAVWIPVPPRPGKMHAQGWDQVDYLVRHLPPKKQTVMRLLKRLKSESQKTLKREERMKNLQGKIVCKKPPVQRVLLLDDVITTGATMEACAFALKEAGSERVFGVSLFYT
jgi:ComF family protein